MTCTWARARLFSQDETRRVPETSVANEPAAAGHGEERLISAETERQLVSGLTSSPRSIPSDFYYDDVGSALFEVQCMQSDYYLNGLEKQIIADCGGEILEAMDPEVLVDLGCGNAEKTQILLAASPDESRLGTVLLVDLNESVLPAAKRAIEQVFCGDVSVETIAGSYEEALRQSGVAGGRTAVLFLGSTIGNMTDLQIRSWGAELRANLRSGGFVLIGADLHKTPEELLRAYNDRRGVARLTNLNVLSHLNDRYGADFNLDLFEHLVLYYESDNALRSHLVSLAAQTVRLPALGLEVELEPGELIQTELERKFRRDELQEVLRVSGFELERFLTDRDDAYSMQLYRVAPVESWVKGTTSGATEWQREVEITADYHDDRCLVGAGI